MSARNLLQNYFPFFQQFSDAILSFTRPSPLSFLQVFGGELALQRALTQETARLSSLNNLLSHRYASGSISGYKFRASWLKNPKRLVFFGLLLFSLQFRAEVLGNHPVPLHTVAAKVGTVYEDLHDILIRFCKMASFVNLVLDLNEPQLIYITSIVMIVTAVIVAFCLIFLKAEYGRYFAASSSQKYGFGVNPKIAWFVQELPAFVVPCVLLFFARKDVFGLTPNAFLLLLYFTHYTHRLVVCTKMFKPVIIPTIPNFSLAVSVITQPDYITDCQTVSGKMRNNLILICFSLNNKKIVNLLFVLFF